MNQFILISLMVLLISASTFDQEMLWGTYKPQLIHAITQRRLDTYNPITISLMYYNKGYLLTPKDIFYKVPERRTDLIQYQVTHQDGTNLQVQDVIDPFIDFNFRTSFLKINQDEFIDELSNLEKTDGTIQVIYNFALEQNNPDLKDTRTFTVERYSMGYQVQVTEGQKVSSFYISYQTLGRNHKMKEVKGTLAIAQLFLPYELNWDPRTYIFNYLQGDASLVSNNPNMVSFIFTLPKSSFFKIQVQHFDDPVSFGFIKDFNTTITQQKIKLEDKFKRVYYSANAVVDSYQFACAFNSYSQMMAGLQFCYGDLVCQQESENCVEKKAMLSHTPSRFGFPRPFLWDEGFQNELSCWMNPYVCLQSLTDWINTISKNGWIPREQARGQELRSYIPGIVEDQRETNPPTFFFNFDLLLTNFPGDERIQNQIGQLYPKLYLWYQSWFSTQSVPDDQGEFTGFMKWWGPSEDYNLGSGMDDWPRSHGNQFSKYNVDAQAWGQFLTQKMLQLANIYDKNNLDFIELLTQRIVLLDRNLHNVLLDAEDLLFKDVLYDKDDLDRKNIFSPHFGYPNFLPIAMGLIDVQDDALINAQIKYMSDASSVWTPYGLRSLDMKDEFFGKEDNYWRGPIWINFHYLILRGLKLFYGKNKSAQDFYTKLRSNIIGTVCGNFDSTGFFFEHYNQRLDGAGHGNHPFNGWTSTISLIITEKY